MASFNKVILVGNLVADPELKKTQSGVSVCSFQIAVNRRFQKEGQHETDFFGIVAWRNTAEFVSRYFHKGKPILVCGQLQTRSWTDQNGQKRYTTEVVADEATFVENKSNESSAPSYAGDQSGFEELSSEEELPF
jgi:single-strand DNA-binding protein